MNLKLLVKKSYVAIAKGLGRLLRRAGLLSVLERKRHNRLVHWVLSLFAIHDVDQMIALDVPWWTYDAIARVDTFLARTPNARVFEYGSGASTVWLAKRAGHIQSVEHDAGWFDLMHDRVAPLSNVALSHIGADTVLSADPTYHSQKEGYQGQSFERYAMAIADSAVHFDLIVIDGRGRNGCLKEAQRFLAAGGMIVFDNSKRARYRRAIDASEMAAVHLSGLTPALPYPDQTSLLTTPARTGDGR